VCIGLDLVGEPIGFGQGPELIAVVAAADRVVRHFENLMGVAADPVEPDARRTGGVSGVSGRPPLSD